MPLEQNDPQKTRIDSPQPATAPQRDISSLPTISDSGGSAPSATGVVRMPPFGRYRLTRLLGEGGMGAAWLAEDPLMQRTVVLKTLKQQPTPEGQQRFQLEIRATAQLSPHPGIVTVYDAGVDGGQMFYTMEHVDGESLEACAQRERKLPPQRAAQIVHHAAMALAHAHAHNVVHRDVKPANILLDKDGRPKLADFGLAKCLDDADHGLTHTGAIMGTPSYMSPEQASGRAGAVTAASDIYSLGCVLYRLLAGREPFKADTVLKLLKKVLQEDPVAPERLNDDVPRDLSAVCLKAMEKEPRQRYASAAEFANDLQRYLDGAAVRARPITAPQRLWRHVSRNRKRMALLAALVVICAAAMVVAALRVAYRENLSVLREQEGGPPAEGTEYSLRFLLSAVRDSDAATRACAVTALARQKVPRAVEVVVSSAGDTDPGVRVRVLDACVSLPRDAARTVLKRLATDPQFMVRAKSFDTIARLKMDGLDDEVRQALASTDPFTRNTARSALLMTVSEDETRRILSSLLNDDAALPALRVELLTCMVNGALPPDLPAAVRLLGASDETLRRSALRLLQRATSLNFGPDAEPWSDWLSARRSVLNVRFLALVVSAGKGALAEGDIITHVAGIPCTPTLISPLPDGPVRLLRDGKTVERSHESSDKPSLFAAYVVYDGGTVVSQGEIETRIRAMARKVSP